MLVDGRAEVLAGVLAAAIAVEDHSSRLRGLLIDALKRIHIQRALSVPERSSVAA